MEIVINSLNNEYKETICFKNSDNFYETFTKFSSIKGPLEAKIFVINDAISSHQLSKFKNIFDKIICVKTPLNIIHERICNRENYSKKRVDKILDSQLSQDVKCSMSDFCIENTSKEKLLSEINRIHSLLL